MMKIIIKSYQILQNSFKFFSNRSLMKKIKNLKLMLFSSIDFTALSLQYFISLFKNQFTRLLRLPCLPRLLVLV